MHKKQLAAVVFVSILFLGSAHAAFLLRISSIELLDSQNQIRTTLSLEELNKIKVRVTNIGDTACDTSRVTINLFKSDLDESILTAPLTSADQVIAPKDAQDFIFLAKDLSFASKPAPDTYRVTADANCALSLEQSRTLFFSLSTPQTFSIPETGGWLALLTGILAALFVWPLSRNQKVKKK